MREGVALIGRTAAASVALLAALSGCREPTQITLEIHTDLECGRYDDTSIAVGMTTAVEKMPATTATSACRDDGYVGTLVAVPGANDEALGIKIAAATGGIEVGLCLAPDYYEGCIVARRTLNYVDDASLRLPIHMREACIDEYCEDGKTCVNGTCEDATITDPGLCADEAGCPEDELYPPDGSPPGTLVLTSPGAARRPRIVHTDAGWAMVWLTDEGPYYALVSDEVDEEVVAPTAAPADYPAFGGPELVFAGDRVVTAVWSVGADGIVTSFPPTSPWREGGLSEITTAGEVALAAVDSTVIVAVGGDGGYAFSKYDATLLQGSGPMSVELSGTDPMLAAINKDQAVLTAWTAAALRWGNYVIQQQAVNMRNGMLLSGEAKTTAALAAAPQTQNGPAAVYAVVERNSGADMLLARTIFTAPDADMGIAPLLLPPEGAGWTAPSLVWAGGAFRLAWTEARTGGNKLLLARFAGEPPRLGTPVTVSDDPSAASSSVAAGGDGAYVAVAWVADVGGERQVHVKRFATDLTAR